MGVILRLDEEKVFELLHAVAQSSCGYDKPYDEKPIGISMLHCCDYNETVHELMDLLTDLELEDEDNKEYLEILRAERRKIKE